MARTKRLSVVYLGAFICGVSLTNQHTSILVEIPLIIWILNVTKIYKDFRRLIATSAFFLVGLSIYGILPFFAIRMPHAGSWGNVTTVSGFFHHVFRKDYGTLQLYSGNDDLSEGPIERTRLWLYDFSFVQSGNPSIFLCALLGSILLWGSSWNISRGAHTKNSTNKMKRNAKTRAKNMIHNEWQTQRIGRIVVVSFLFYLSIFHSLSNLPLDSKLLFGVHQRFWMQANIFCFVFAGVGMTKIGSKIMTFGEKSGMAIIVCWSLASMTHSYYRWIEISDQTSNTYFSNYAHGILDTLPKNSLLLINYDQQWTSVRYLQECEGVRSDVTSINLSMMSYPWWSEKIHLYPEIVFPGTHYVRENTPQWHNGGFTFSELLDANFNGFKGRIFSGGQLNFPDTNYLNNYTEVPYGMSVQYIKRSDPRSVDIEYFRKRSLRIWKTIAKFHVNNLPSDDKYSEKTWEWTIKREFYHHFVTRATHLLDMAVSSDSGSTGVLKSLVESAAWLEVAQMHDKYSITPALKKNLGIAYMNMVRNKEGGKNAFLPDVDDIFSDVGNKEFMGMMAKKQWWIEGVKKDADWKSWASNRWSDTWGEFLAMEGADKEPGYTQVKNIYQEVMMSIRGTKLQHARM